MKCLPRWRVPGPEYHDKILGFGSCLWVSGLGSQMKEPRWRVMGPKSLLSWYAWSFISRKKSLKVVNNRPTVGLWRSLTCQNFHTDISPLIFVTDLVDFYALLSENISFLDYFWWFHIYFVRYCNNPTEITRNQTKRRYKRVIFFEMFLRGLWDVCFIGDLIEMSQIHVMPVGKVSENPWDDHDLTSVV